MPSKAMAEPVVKALAFNELVSRLFLRFLSQIKGVFLVYYFLFGRNTIRNQIRNHRRLTFSIALDVRQFFFSFFSFTFPSIGIYKRLNTVVYEFNLTAST